MISGYFAVNSIKKGFKDFLSGKVIQLLLPCFTWGIVWQLLFFLQGEGLTDFEQILHYFIFNYWFLKCLFCCLLIYYVSFKYVHSLLLSAVLSLVISYFAPFNSSILYPFFLLGSFLHQYEHKYIHHIGFITLISFVLFISLNCLLEADANRWKYEYWSNNGYSILTAMAGCVFIFGSFSFFRNFIQKTPLLRRIAELGIYTLGIYILQRFILEDFLTYIVCLDSCPFVLANFMINPILSACVLFVCIWIIERIEKNKIACLLFLGKIKV